MVFHIKNILSSGSMFWSNFLKYENHPTKICQMVLLSILSSSVFFIIFHNSVKLFNLKVPFLLNIFENYCFLWMMFVINYYFLWASFMCLYRFTCQEHEKSQQGHWNVAPKCFALKWCDTFLL